MIDSLADADNWFKLPSFEHTTLRTVRLVPFRATCPAYLRSPRLDRFAKHRHDCLTRATPTHLSRVHTYRLFLVMPVRTDCTTVLHDARRRWLRFRSFTAARHAPARPLLPTAFCPTGCFAAPSPRCHRNWRYARTLHITTARQTAAPGMSHAATALVCRTLNNARAAALERFSARARTCCFAGGHCAHAAVGCVIVDRLSR